ASDFIETLAKNGEKPDIVFMDPPRAGSTKKFVDALGDLMPDRIVYISCNPETLARDLYFIKKKGYKVKKICPVDMFPHTNHIESIACLTRTFDNELP
ncbi:MAG: 23S rRNA (uracil(1939)-C(5))-methyltransferase RlmD, partial [Oscillospiraceae bacterium]|nr:23S rRNA (uracil(1939)-C(5))-methyltransferase RlmD [Oscillospiraceae bacterium]